MTKQTCASKSKVALNAAFAAILAVGLSVPAASAFAAPSDDKQAEAQAALQKLNQYQSELDQASANYEAAHQEQIDAQNRVDEAQKQIEDKTAQIEKDQQRLSDRARDMYRSGDTNFLDVILGASSFEQFATTWNMLETLNGNDAELVSETKTAREELQAAKQEAEQAKVASDKAEEAKSVAEAADQKASEMQQTYNSLSAEAQELISQERAAQEAQQQAAAAAAEQNGTAGNDAATTITNNNRNNTTSSNSNSSSNSNKNNASSSATNNSKPQSVSGNSVVNRAYSQLGKPYQWGAFGPNSFDCSGLVSYCLTGSYSRLGTTGTFMGWTRVSSPQPGDICVNSHHCGIYIGGGQMIHAPRTGDVVKVSSVHSDMIYVRY